MRASNARRGGPVSAAPGRLPLSARLRGEPCDGCGGREVVDVRVLYCANGGKAKALLLCPNCVKENDMAKKAKKPTKALANGTAKPHGMKAAKAGDPPRIERKRYKTKLPCPINPEDVVIKADQLAVVVRQLEEHRAEKRTALAGFRDEKAHLEEKLGELATAVEQHTVTRDVECVDYLERGHIVTVRQDTMEQVGEPKKASAEDLQESIFSKVEAASGKDWSEGANPAPPPILDGLGLTSAPDTEPEQELEDGTGDYDEEDDGDGAPADAE
jgi:hypothetical protein